MKPKSKIVKHLDTLINQIPRLSKEKYIPHSEKYDLWKRRVELFLGRVCGGKVAEEFKNITKEEKIPLPVSWSIFREGESFEKRFKLQREREIISCRAALCKARNLLKAVKENIELFESDKEAKKEAGKIKRKYKGIELGLPWLKYKRGEEVETKEEYVK